MNGAQLVVEALKSHNITHVFGYPGMNILPVYDVLRNSGIKHILSTHEQFACHSADGYARASGKVGVVMATSGPGATNLVTGIANAYMDSIPLVAITGNVRLPLLGHDAFQEIDIAGVTMPITKHNFIVKSVDDLADVLKRSFCIAQSGRKGPVLVDIPSDVFDYETNNVDVTPLPLRRYPIDDEEIDIAAKTINESTNPFLCIGGGAIASEASDFLFEFAHKLDCPVAVTAMGKGSFPASDRLYAGVVGMELSEKAKQALEKADLFIAVGARFSEKLLKNVCLYAPNARILHIDIDIAETGKNTVYHSRVVGDIKDVLIRLFPLINSKKSNFDGIQTDSDGVFGVINKYIDGKIVTTEVGLHQIEAVNKIKTEKARSFITSGGLGTMGYGLPAAIGSAIVSGKQVINLAGDGSFCMNIQEIMTALKYNLDIIQIVFNNHSLGMIEKRQIEAYSGRLYQNKAPDVDFAAVTSAMGAKTFCACGKDEFDKAMKEAVTEKGVKVIVLEDYQ